ncbi:MAG: hypothetical protein HY809_00290 [Nitrospirae bacterium]|nr:hypothetical protein [Nitrospirota bacterium]
MAVVIKIDEKGNKSYAATTGVGSSSDERGKADKLDNLIADEMAKLEILLSSENKEHKHGSKDKVEAYWELGSVLRKIFLKSRLIEPSEKHLYWINARMHTPKSLLADDRGHNRLHLEYCFRLAGFSKEKAQRMKWSEWVYLFDSPGINREERFDRWLDSKMNDSSIKLSRESIRLFVQCANQILGKKETSKLLDDELFRCYISAWMLQKKLLLISKDIRNNELKERLKYSIRKNYNQIGQVIDNFLLPEAFVDEIIREVAK